MTYEILVPYLLPIISLPKWVVHKKKKKKKTSKEGEKMYLHVDSRELCSCDVYKNGTNIEAFAASLMEENHYVQQRDGEEARGVECMWLWDSRGVQCQGRMVFEGERC